MLIDYYPYGIAVHQILIRFINDNHLSITSHTWYDNHASSIYPINSFYNKHLYQPIDGKQLTGQLLVIFTVYKEIISYNN